MAKNDNKGKGIAFAKRAKISKAQQMMLIAISGAAMVFGVTVVGVIYLVKVIRFNVVIIEENDSSIAGLTRVQANLKTIASKVGVLAGSENLEVMANKRLGEECKRFKAEGFEYSLSTINTARTCSGLRVIPDTLPSSLNQEATTSSLNWLINESGASLEGLVFKSNGSMFFPTVTDSLGNVDLSRTITVSPVDLSVSVQDSAAKVRGMLDIIENSIRNYDVYSIQMSWSDGGIELNGVFSTYYSRPKTIDLKTKQICANKKSTKCTAGRSSSK